MRIAKTINPLGYANTMLNPLRHTCALLLVLLSLMLAACGSDGGGGGNDDSGGDNDYCTGADCEDDCDDDEDGGPIYASVRDGDRDAVENSSITLRGDAEDSSCSGYDSDDADFEWVQTGGPAVVLQRDGHTDVIFTAPETEVPLVLEFQLTVTDRASGDTDTDSVQVTVHKNFPPELAVRFPLNNMRYFSDSNGRNFINVYGTFTAEPGDDVVLTMDVNPNYYNTSSFGFSAPASSMVDAPHVGDETHTFTWISSARLDNTGGQVTVTVDIADSANETAPQQQRVFENAPTFSNILMALNTDNPDAVFVMNDRKPDPWVNLFRLELASGVVEYRPSEHGGTSLGYLGTMVFDNVNKRLLVSEIGERWDYPPGGVALTAIKKENSMKTVLSDFRTGNGPDFGTIDDMVVDAADNRVLVLDSSRPAVLAVDLTTGNRGIISDNTGTRGTGENLTASIHRIALDTQSDPARALVYDAAGEQVIAVQLNNGNRTVFSSAGVGTGAAFNAVRDIALDAAGGVLGVLQGNGELIAVDLDTGNRTVLSDNASGVSLGYPYELLFDADNERYLISDFSPDPGNFDNDQLVAVAAADGARTVVYTQNVGSGASLSAPRALALDDANSLAYIAEGFTDRLVRVDLSNGNRTEVATGLPPATADLVFDSENDRVLLVDPDGNALIEVALATGVQTVVSALGAAGPGPSLDVPKRVAYDPDTGTAYVINATTVFTVDVGDGTRTILADASTGDGPDFIDLRGVVLDKANNRLVVADKTGVEEVTVLTVSLDTGNRSVVATGSSEAPEDLVLDQLNNVYVIEDYRLMKVSLSSGTTRYIWGHGEDVSLQHIEYSAAQDFLYATSLNSEALHVMLPSSGDIAIISK